MAPNIRFHLDEHVNPAIADGLRRRSRTFRSYLLPSTKSISRRNHPGYGTHLGSARFGRNAQPCGIYLSGGEWPALRDFNLIETVQAGAHRTAARGGRIANRDSPLQEEFG